MKWMMVDTALFFGGPILFEPGGSTFLQIPASLDAEASAKAERSV